MEVFLLGLTKTLRRGIFKEIVVVVAEVPRLSDFE